MTWRNRLAPLLTSMSLVSCVLIGAWFWVTPIEYGGFINDLPTVRHQSFSDISLLIGGGYIPASALLLAALWACNLN